MCASPLMAMGPVGGAASAVFPEQTKKLNESFKTPIGGAISLVAPETGKKVNKTLKKVSDVTKPIVGGGIAHLS